MRRYTPVEIQAFLIAIDQNLTEPAEIIVIGGTAAALVYAHSGATQDIDTHNSISSIEAALKSARLQTGYNIPVNPAAIHDAPWNWEERLVHYKRDLFKYLSVKAPEAIDLILMKVMRAEAHDLAAIKAIVQSQSIHAMAIHDRFKSEMDHVIKDPAALKLNYLSMIDLCFGSELASELDRDLDLNKSKC
jgi:hypothetical protein